MYEILSIEEVGSTQENVGASSFLQSVFWADFKERSGWKRKLFLVSPKNESSQKSLVFYLSVILRHIKFFGQLAYIPMLEDVCDNCEDVDNTRREFLQALLQKLFELLPPDVFVIRTDPSWQEEVDNKGGCASHTDKVERPSFNFGKEWKDLSEDIKHSSIHRLKIKKAKTDIQPPDTVILPLEKSEDEIMGQFKSKWRYNIRLAEKKGCVIECMAMASDAEIDASIDVFYSLYQTTAKRDGIAIHTKDYYKRLFLLAICCQV